MKSQTDNILNDYYTAIGRMNCYFQMMEYVYKSAYFSFIEEHFREKSKNYSTPFKDIIKDFEKKVTDYYKEDTNTLKDILDFINRSKQLVQKRHYYIHSYIIIMSENGDEKVCLHKRTKESILPYEVVDGKFVNNDDYSILSIEDINETSGEITQLNAELVFYSHKLGVARQNKFENLNEYFKYVVNKNNEN